MEAIIEARSSIKADNPDMANLIQLALFGSDLTTLAALDNWLNKLSSRPKTIMGNQLNGRKIVPPNTVNKHYKGTSGKAFALARTKKHKTCIGKIKQVWLIQFSTTGT